VGGPCHFASQPSLTNEAPVRGLDERTRQRHEGPPTTIVNRADDPHVAVRLVVPEELEFDLIRPSAVASKFLHKRIGFDSCGQALVGFPPESIKRLIEQPKGFLRVHEIVVGRTAVSRPHLRWDGRTSAVHSRSSQRPIVTKAGDDGQDDAETSDRSGAAVDDSARAASGNDDALIHRVILEAERSISSAPSAPVPSVRPARWVAVVCSFVLVIFFIFVVFFVIVVVFVIILDEQANLKFTELLFRWAKPWSDH